MRRRIAARWLDAGARRLALAFFLAGTPAQAQVWVVPKVVRASALVAAPTIGAPRFELLGVATIAGDARDASGVTDAPGGIPHDQLGSFGSGIDWMGRGDEYVACEDRGPLDGAVAWRCRVQRLRITIVPGGTGEDAVSVSLRSTTLLSDEAGAPLVGIASACEGSDQRAMPRFDPEGIRVLPDGGFWLCDEYGPWIDEFGADGRRRRRIEVPEEFRVASVSSDPTKELPPHNSRGRQANRGFEGLARSADGSTLWAMLQSPLIQDGALDARGKRVGTNIRVLEVSVATGATRELVYTLESPAHGVNEILAFDEGALLVLERDGRTGAPSRSIRVYRFDLSDATDVSGVASLPARGLPAGIRAGTKSLWLDMMDPRFGLSAPTMPEKIEGLTLGPRLADGRRTLIVTSDNDFKTTEATRIWVFAFQDVR